MPYCVRIACAQPGGTGAGGICGKPKRAPHSTAAHRSIDVRIALAPAKNISRCGAAASTAGSASIGGSAIRSRIFRGSAIVSVMRDAVRRCAQARPSASLSMTAGAASRGAIQSRSTNHANSKAPTLKIVSPGMRSHTSSSTTGSCTNAAERPNQ